MPNQCPDKNWIRELLINKFRLFCDEIIYFILSQAKFYLMG